MIREVVVSGNYARIQNSDVDLHKKVVYKITVENGEPVIKKLVIDDEFKYISHEKLHNLIISMLRSNSIYFTISVHKSYVSSECEIMIYGKDKESFLMKEKLKNDNFKFYTLDKLLEIYDFYRGD